MTETTKSPEQWLLERIESDLVLGEDGYYVYWPEQYTQGYLSEYHLTLILRLLKEKNKEWDEQVQNDPSIG